MMGMKNTKKQNINMKQRGSKQKKKEGVGL
jgi:hypothetical protein